MPSSSEFLPELRRLGFDISAVSHAQAILEHDFSEALSELQSVLSSFTIDLSEIVAGGGGETTFTQRLRRAFAERNWTKRVFDIRKLIDNRETQSASHEVDHVRVSSAGTLAMEIEWNNKDPFFDRDLDNFKRLHGDGAISAGIIITRGSSMQAGFRDLVRRFAEAWRINASSQLRSLGVRPTERQERAIQSRMEGGSSFAEAWSTVFCSDKFGEATTHWAKLESRVRRGVGNPCPLLLIGIPLSVVQVKESATRKE